MSCVILSQLGFDPFALFLSLSSIILAFAFMLASASSKYFEGLLFILVQRPYDIGDRINIEPQNSPGRTGGSASWIVKDVTLFTTTVSLVRCVNHLYSAFVGYLTCSFLPGFIAYRLSWGRR